MTSKLPRSSNSAFPIVKEIIELGWIEMPSQFRGNGAPGNTLEYLLDVEQNNHDLPDLKDWEVKFHGGNALLTLFHKEPSPRGIVNNLVDKYGWENEKEQLSFRHTIKGKSNKGFNIIDEKDKIIVRNTKFPEIEPYWDHNTILGAFGAKLRRLILVHGKVNAKERRVRYNSAIAYWDLDLIRICQAIEKGIIYIDFDARTKKGRGSSLRNHGTKFRININDIGVIYQHQQKII